MNYSTFLEMITEEIKKQIGANAQIHVSKIQRINLPDEDGMTILFPGENAAPAIYLNSFYQEYLNGTDTTVLVEEILAFYYENKKNGACDISFYKNFEQVRNHIVCRLVNHEKNRTILEQVPHRRFLDLAIVYYYQMECNSFGKASVLIKNTHITPWGISLETLHDLAVQNTRRLLPYRITTLNSMLSELSDQRALSIPDEAAPSMYILTNEEMSYGAANIIFDDLLRSISKKLKGDFYILPSSIHECLLLPICSWNDTRPQKLQEIVSEINEKYIDAEELLGNHVYRYACASGSLSIAA